MSVDREVQTGPDERPTGPRRDPPVSRATMVAYAAAAVVLVGWFLFGWLVLRQGLINSAGEALGTGFALLLVVSIVGTARRRHE